jgi:uncharacterized DUF497 family protein
MAAAVVFGSFEWDAEEKERSNLRKHYIAFREACLSFLDGARLIAVDELHSAEEPRYFCVGLIGSRVATLLPVSEIVPS